jgi:hypothetical protein
VRWILALALPAGCGLTLDFGPRATQSNDGGVGVPDAEEVPVIDPNTCTLRISRVVDVDDFQVGAVDVALIGSGMYGAHRRATGEVDPPVIAERIAGTTRTQVAETEQTSNVDRVVVRGSLGAVLVGSLSSFGLGQGSLNVDVWDAPFPLMSTDAFDVAGTDNRMAPWILGTVRAGDGAVELVPVSETGTAVRGPVPIMGSFRDIALSFDATAVAMHVALVGQSSPHEVSYMIRDEDTILDTFAVDTADAVPLDDGSPAIRIVPVLADRYVLYAYREDTSRIARLAGPSPLAMDTREDLPGTSAVAAFNPRLPDTLAVAFIRDGMLEIELLDRYDVTRRQNRVDPLMPATELAMMPAAHPDALYVALVADGGAAKYAFIDCEP